jgi:hypothetical protein
MSMVLIPIKASKKPTPTSGEDIKASPAEPAKEEKKVEKKTKEVKPIEKPAS